MGLDMQQPSVVTVDDTSIDALYDGIPEDCVVGYVLRVIAASDTGYAHWEKRFLARRVGESEVIIDGICDVFPPILNAGASAWAVEVCVDNGYVCVDVQGSADTQVFWLVDLHGDEIPTVSNDRMNLRTSRRLAR